MIVSSLIACLRCRRIASDRPEGRLPRQRGFTLLEMLVILVVLGLLAALAVPTLISVIHRSRIEGAAQTMTRLMLEARAEAIYRGAPVIVHPDIRTDGGGNEQHYLVAWVDVNENGKFDGLIAADGSYQANASITFPTVDYPLYQWQLPSAGSDRTHRNLYFWGAADADPTLGTDVVDGLTTKADGADDPSMLEADGYGDWEVAVVFLDNGSVVEQGALRVAMGPFGGGELRVNFLELRIAPRASGRVELRKFIPSPIASYQPKGYGDDSSDQSNYAYEWKWY